MQAVLSEAEVKSLRVSGGLGTIEDEEMTCGADWVPSFDVRWWSEAATICGGGGQQTKLSIRSRSFEAIWRSVRHLPSWYLICVPCVFDLCVRPVCSNGLRIKRLSHEVDCKQPPSSDPRVFVSPAYVKNFGASIQAFVK